MRLLGKIALSCLLAMPLSLVFSTAQAQSPTEAPLRWIIPYPAGGGTDFLARSLSGPLSDALRQPVNLENRAGETPEGAIKEAIAAKPDGRTFVSADNGILGLIPFMQPGVSYDPETGLKPVSLMARFPLVLAVKPDSGFKTLDALVQAIKASPERYTFGSAGAGTPHHVAMALFNRQIGVTLSHVPSRGAAASVVSLLAGHVNVIMVDTAAAAGFIRSGKIRPLAVVHDQRLANLPDLPTLTEAGYPGVSMSALVGLFVPAQTPDAVAQALGAQVNALLKLPETVQKLQAFGIEPIAGSASDCAQAMTREREQGRAAVDTLGLGRQ